MKKILDAKLLKELSSEFGNAFYLLESEQFKKNYLELKSAFATIYPKFNIAYSYKTNYTPKLAQIVDNLGGYAEVVSDMEMEIALKAGVDAKRIIWNGPIKNISKVEELLLKGGTVNVDSLDEMESIELVAQRNTIATLNIGIRVNYDVGDGVLSRFGFDVDGQDFILALDIVKRTKNLKLVNLQAHFAKRAPEYWTARAEGMLKVYDFVSTTYGIKPERLDIGGGLYGNMPDTLRIQLGIGSVSYKDYAERAAKQFANHFKNNANSPWLFIEPGTAVAGDCMRFVCRIESIKEIRGKTIATAYGSQKNISMSGINPPLEIISVGENSKVYDNLDIVGFTCIEGDVLQKNYCGPLSIGDYIVISNCGSYSLVMKPPFILPNFPVLDINGDGVEIIKRAETFDDLFRTFSFGINDEQCNV